jgi:hypothetical protein
MKETLISFETAKLAKEKGFNIFQDSWYNKDGEECFIEHSDYCFSDYFNFKELDNGELITEDGIYSASTQSLLQKWLREKHNIIIIVEPYCNGSSSCKFIWNRFILNNIWFLDSFSMEKHEKYEKALEVGLYEVLKTLK